MKKEKKDLNWTFRLTPTTKDKLDKLNLLREKRSLNKILEELVNEKYSQISNTGLKTLENLTTLILKKAKEKNKNNNKNL